MFPNLIVIVACGLIPIVMSMIYYHPSVLGTMWLKEAGMTRDDMKANQKPLKFLLGFILNVLLAFGVFTMVTHEFSVAGLVGGDPELMKEGTTAAAFLAEHAGNFSNFGHGAAHGIMIAIVAIAPFIGHVYLWSGKSFKLFLLDWVFWTLAVIVMGGVISQWGAVMPAA